MRTNMTLHFPAQKTLQLIEDVMTEDQGASFRGWLGKVIPHIGDAYRTDEDGFRSHLGASLLGSDCARMLWYSFRWAKKAKFNSRTLRLFNRGHMEEARFISILLTIGCEVMQQDAKGKQYRITDSHGHVGGSCDGIVTGIPDLPQGEYALTEFKTHNNKSFTTLKLQGVRESKFQHYVQCNIYMRKMGLGVTLYMAVNKDTDELYAELIPINTELADEFLIRGYKIVNSDAPPDKLNESPGYYKCRFCDYRGICHLQETPHVNCRTCAYSMPVKDAQWLCSKIGIINKEQQLSGCDRYVRGF